MVEAAVGNYERGKEVMQLLLEQRGLDVVINERGANVQITPQVVEATEGNERRGKEMIQLLLKQRGADFQIMPLVVEAAAENKRSGKEVIQLLLEPRGADVLMSRHSDMNVIISAKRDLATISMQHSPTRYDCRLLTCMQVVKIGSYAYELSQTPLVDSRFSIGNQYVETIRSGFVGGHLSVATKSSSPVRNSDSILAANGASTPTYLSAYSLDNIHLLCLTNIHTRPDKYKEKLLGKVCACCCLRPMCIPEVTCFRSF
jgi:hypothetical protein